MNKLARQIIDSDIGDTSKGILIPLVKNYLLETGGKSQYSDKEGILIVVNLLLEQNDRIKGRKERVTFGGSNSSQCMRQQMFDLKLGRKGRTEPDYKLLSIFDDGNWRNLRWILMFHRMGILKTYEETGFSKKYNISWTPDCRLDLSPYYGEEWSDVPVEIKGMNNNEFGEFRRRSGRGNFASSRTMQVHTYMLASGLKHWLVWAENKNTQDLEEFWMPRDANIIRYLKNRYKYMNDALVNKALPAVECELDDSDPKYVRCHRKRDCHKAIMDGEATLDSMKGRVLQQAKASRAFV